MIQPHDEKRDVGWERLGTRDAIVEAFGVGRRKARLGRGAGAGGEWYWEDGLSCRRASLDSEDLGLDREVIEKRVRQMRYSFVGGAAPLVVASLSGA